MLVCTLQWEHNSAQHYHYLQQYNSHLFMMMNGSIGHARVTNTIHFRGTRARPAHANAALSQRSVPKQEFICSSALVF